MIRRSRAEPSGLGWLRGLETVSQSGRGGWPGDEFLHPLPLSAMALLAVNDHWLKGSGVLPGWLTGKLSDFAGLIFFPLFVTALANSAAYVAFRLVKSTTVNYSFSRTKLVASIAFTAALFVPLQLSTWWASVWEIVLEKLDVLNLFPGFSVTADPTDLVALIVFPLVYWHGRRTLRRVPVGRLAVLRRRMTRVDEADMKRVFAEGTADLQAVCGSERARRELEKLGEKLAAFVHTGEAARETEAEEALDAFRRAAS
jgi:hypothetical protein